MGILWVCARSVGHCCNILLLAGYMNVENAWAGKDVPVCAPSPGTVALAAQGGGSVSVLGVTRALVPAESSSSSVGARVSAGIAEAWDAAASFAGRGEDRQPQLHPWDPRFPEQPGGVHGPGDPLVGATSPDRRCSRLLAKAPSLTDVLGRGLRPTPSRRDGGPGSGTGPPPPPGTPNPEPHVVSGVRCLRHRLPLWVLSGFGVLFCFLIHFY